VEEFSEKLRASCRKLLSRYPYWCQIRGICSQNKWLPRVLSFMPERLKDVSLPTMKRTKFASLKHGNFSVVRSSRNGAFNTYYVDDKWNLLISKTNNFKVALNLAKRFFGFTFCHYRKRNKASKYLQPVIYMFQLLELFIIRLVKSYSKSKIVLMQTLICLFLKNKFSKVVSILRKQNLTGKSRSKEVFNPRRVVPKGPFGVGGLPPDLKAESSRDSIPGNTDIHWDNWNPPKLSLEDFSDPVNQDNPEDESPDEGDESWTSNIDEIIRLSLSDH